MSSRRLLVLVFGLVVFAASPAIARADHGPLWSQPAAEAAQLVADDYGATVVWAAADGAGATLVARRFDPAGEPLDPVPAVLVDGIVGLSDWLATTDGDGGVIVAWKAAGTTWVRRVAAGGAGSYDPVAVCSDAAVAALRGPGATAAPVQLAADGRGGVYVRLLATPSLASGDTLLAYVSPLGASALPDPGLAVVKGTVAGMSADDLGHLFVLLGAPGRSGVAAQRFASDLRADWDDPIPPYNPLLGPPPASPQTPADIVTETGATVSWLESGKVKVQRYSSGGDRLWLRPVAVSASGSATLAGDTWGGCYVVEPAGDGLRVRHLAADGGVAGDAAGSAVHLGLTAPHVDDASCDRAGDLTIAYGDGATSAGLASMTYLGAWSSPALSPAPTGIGALKNDGAGGEYALGTGAAARLWRLGQAGGAVTFRPRESHVVYGETVGVAGYLTAAGVPLPRTEVQIRVANERGLGMTAATATTDDQGFYHATITPKSGGTWTAVAPGPAGETIVSDPFGSLTVAPEVSITLGNRRVGGRWVEQFSGAVAPAFAGRRVLVQRRSGGSWRTVASGSLDRRSRYQVSWPLPLRAATHLFRTILPAPYGYETGVSRTARLRVVVKAGGAEALQPLRRPPLRPL
jgi:hypothetical protein